MACDAEAVRRCRETRADFYSYRCHAGLCEFLLPIYEGGEPIAYLVFGQLLDDSSVLQQWEHTASLLDWYDGGRSVLDKGDYATLYHCSTGTTI